MDWEENKLEKVLTAVKAQLKGLTLGIGTGTALVFRGGENERI